MICPECGRNSERNSDVCRYCGKVLSNSEQFIWTELPPLPILKKPKSNKTDDTDNSENKVFSSRIRRFIIRFAAVFVEITVLAAVITGVYLWNSRNNIITIPEAQNIVYSSEDIVMMLVKRKYDWIIPPPENGFSTCTFLDLDFDGSPELMSISYDNDSYRTEAKAYRIRNCTLEELPINYNEEPGFFDIGSSLSLCYAPDTKEMLYISSRYYDGTTSLGSFYLQDNQILGKLFISNTLSNGIYRYSAYDDEEKPYDITRREFAEKQAAVSARLTDLKLSYEWVGGYDLENISAQKLAALLIRSYDSFGYDSSGLALQ